MKIAIDCRMIDSSGIGNFLKNLLFYWQSENDVSFVLIGKEEHLQIYNFFNSKIVDCGISIFSLHELFLFPVKEINECDIFYSPNYNIPLGIKIPIVSTIHDVVFLDNPSITSKLDYLIRSLYIKFSYLRSNSIITVSNFSKKRIEYFFGLKKKILVIYNGINKELLNFRDENRNEIKYDFPYIIFVGNIKKHKGLNTLIDAFSIAKDKGFIPKLVIVGEMNNFKTSDSNFMKRIVNKTEIVFTGKVDDNTLFGLIKSANALIQPSTYEGFGMPPLEANFLNTTTIVSDIPVFKEVYSERMAVFFQKENSIDLADKLIKFSNVKRELFLEPIDFQNYNYRDSASKLITFLKNNTKNRR